MIIGCYHGDGTPVEAVNLHDKERMFELEICLVKHPRRQKYTYDVKHESIAFCASKESAEQMLNDILQSGEEWLKDIYCCYLYERVLNVKYDRNEYMSCWLYNKSGEMIDKRTFPSYWSEGGFCGRNHDEKRFKFGDLVELYDGESVSLVYVLAAPRDKEWYCKKSEEVGYPYYGDISDDSYTVIGRVGKGQFVDYMTNHMHVDALALFEPHFSIPKEVLRYFKTFWARYEEDRKACYGSDNLTIYQI